MTRRRLWLFALSALGLAAAAGSLAARWRSAGKPPPSEAPPAILVVDPRDLDFGEVWATDRFEWRLPVHNVSDSEATLVSLVGNCSCVSMKPLPLRVEPGATAYLTLELDLAKWCAAVPDDSQAYRVALAGTVRSGTGEHDVRWVLEGRARHSLRPNPRAVDFGRLWSPALPTERAVDLRPSPGVGSVRAEVADDPTGGVAAEVRPVPDGNRLLLRFNRVMTPGRYRCEVRLFPTTRSGEALGPVRLPVEWEVLGEVQPDTPVVECGPQPVGSVCEQTVTLSSLAGRPFRITGANPGRGGTRVEVPARGADANLTVRVAQRIERAGDQTAEFTVSGTTAAGEPFEVTCRVHYYGLSPTGP